MLTPAAEAFWSRVSWIDELAAAGCRLPAERPESPLSIDPGTRSRRPSIKGVSTSSADPIQFGRTQYRGPTKDPLSRHSSQDVPTCPKTSRVPVGAFDVRGCPTEPDARSSLRNTRATARLMHQGLEVRTRVLPAPPGWRGSGSACEGCAGASGALPSLPAVRGSKRSGTSWDVLGRQHSVRTVCLGCRWRVGAGQRSSDDGRTGTRVRR
jgi:hypothetical protein